MSSIEAYSDNTLQKFEPRRGAAIQIHEAAQRLPVTTQAEYARAAEWVAKIKGEHNSLKKEMDSGIAPLKKVEAQIRGWFKPALDGLAAAEQTLKGKMVAFISTHEAEQRRLAAAAQAKIVEAKQAESAGDVAAVEEARTETRALVNQISLAPKAAGVSMREMWHAEVVDPAQVPREYLIVDQKALDAVARATKGAAEIPGVKFVSTLSPSVRTK